MIAVVVGVLLALCLWRFWWTSNFWRRSRVRGPTGCPLFGNLWEFCIGRRHYGLIFQDIYNSYPDLRYVGVYTLFNEPAIMIRDVNLVKDVLMAKFQHFQDNEIYVDAARDPTILYDPFMAKGEQWKGVRAEVVSTFTPSKVKASFLHIEAVCRRLEEHVRSNLNRNLEAKILFSKYTLDVIASSVFGLDGKCLSTTGSDFVDFVAALFQPRWLSLLETIALVFSPRVGAIINYRFLPVRVQQWLQTIVVKIMKERRSGATANKCDFLQHLLAYRSRTHEAMNETTIVGHCTTFLLEGFETSSALMAYTLSELAANPTVLSRVAREVDEVLRRHNNDVSYAALQEMTYLEAALFETLRMHPALLAAVKRCTEPFLLPPQSSAGSATLGAQYLIPKGMRIVIPVRALHYDATIYEEPTKYRPERFLDEGDAVKGDCAYLGFGQGPRMCPGMRFGLLQSKAGLATILAKFSIHPVNDHQQQRRPAATTFITTSSDGIWMRFAARNDGRWTDVDADEK